MLLPIFTYQVSQFVSCGKIAEAFTDGEVSETGGILIFAAIMLFVESIGGLRAVAYTDIIQGVMLIIGSLIFFIASGVEFGGLAKARDYFDEVGKFQTMPSTAGSWSIISYTSFVMRVAAAATMFPHLAMRLFVAKNSKMLQPGLAGKASEAAAPPHGHRGRTGTSVVAAGQSAITVGAATTRGRGTQGERQHAAAGSRHAEPREGNAAANG